jgi:hypothetical protein
VTVPRLADYPAHLPLSGHPSPRPYSCSAGFLDRRPTQVSQHYPPLRSAEPEPHPEPESAVDSQHVELAARLAEMSQQIRDLTAAHRTFAERLAARQSLMVPSQDPAYGDLAQAFPPWSGGGRDAILQPPKPNIRPSAYVLERAASRDADREAAD